MEIEHAVGIEHQEEAPMKEITESRRFELAVIRAELRTSAVVLSAGRWSVQISQDNRIIVVFLDNTVFPANIRILKPRLCRGGIVRFPFNPQPPPPQKILDKAAELLARKRSIQEHLVEDFSHLPQMAKEIFAVTMLGQEHPSANDTEL